MGMQGVVDLAHARAAGAALHAWGGAIAGAVDELARTLPGVRPPSLEAGAARLAPVARDPIHARGWELRHALAWRNDDRCLQRAAFAAMSIAEADAGDLTRAVGSLARTDAAAAGVAVSYAPRSFGGARMHAAAVARTADGDELLAIDHLVARTSDGVVSLDEWLHRIGGSPDATTILSPLHDAPASLTTAGAGIPVLARTRSATQWRAFADHLARSWAESAQRHLPAYQPVRTA
jgi:hypothetical protein